MGQIIFQTTGVPGSTFRTGNTASATYSTVAGGILNASRCIYGTIGGGTGNTVFSSGATIGGGQRNTIGENTPPPVGQPRKTSPNSVILGGSNNRMVCGSNSFIGGGCNNYADGFCNTIIGGSGNTTYDRVCESTIGGGFGNKTFNSWTTVGGGRLNTAIGIYSTVVGGSGNTTTQCFNTVVGGRNLKATGTYSFMGGGSNNITSANYAIVGGGTGNTSNAINAIVGGGERNTIVTGSSCSSIIGGASNVIRNNSEFSFLGGGNLNTITGFNSVIGGGRSNTSLGLSSSVLGGRLNTASGNYSSIIGGSANTAIGVNSVILSTNSYATGARSAAVGGQGLAAVSADTVYVPYLNIRDLGTNSAVTNIGIDNDGNVVPGQNSSGNFAVDGLLVEATPSTLGPVTPNPLNLSLTSLSNGITQVAPSVIYDDFSAYNTSTGRWTCPSTGRYNLSFFVHLTDSVNGWQNPSTVPGANLDSAVVAGLVNPTTNEVYAANNFFPSVPQLYADINGAQWGVELTAGDQICLKVMNTSGVLYVPSIGDYFRFSLQKVG